jgi:hypothetical protein
MNKPSMQNVESQGYQRAISLLHRCGTETGFLASVQDRDNYRRIWARDGVIMGLAALQAGDPDLIKTFRQTLETLAEHQGPHGEIPSNVDPATRRVSYGGTIGRVDSDLWFVIGCAQYWRRTGDHSFLHQMLPAMERVRFLLGAWEFNNRGFIYVPLTGDWADEYLHNGYVLYDQLLYLQTQRELSAIHRYLHRSADHALMERSSRLCRLIKANFWFWDHEPDEDMYHEVLYEKAQQASHHCQSQHWLPFFSPQGYGYRFDAFANVLASLVGVADDEQRARVDKYIADNLLNQDLPLLPAFFPVITPLDEDWDHLHVTFSYSFKNNPHEYHNGGLWAMLTGFYVADLAARGQTETAQRHLRAIHQANALEHEGEAWSFPEYVHGTKLTPGGTTRLGWSAAAAIIGHQALQGNPVLVETTP